MFSLSVQKESRREGARRLYAEGNSQSLGEANGFWGSSYTVGAGNVKDPT